MLQKFFFQLVDYFIPNITLLPAFELRKARILVITLIVLSLQNFLFIGNAIKLDFTIAFYSLFANGLLTLLAVFLYKYHFSRTFCVNLGIGNCALGVYYLMYFSGGLTSPSTISLFLAPIMFLMLGEKKSSIIWIVLNAIVLSFFYILSQNGHTLNSHYNIELYEYSLFSGIMGMMNILYVTALVFDKQISISLDILEKRNQELASEKKKSDNLLLNILPEEVAEELKETGHSEAQLYSEVSILFTDFVGFTKVAENLSAKALVKEIDYCFQKYDEIIGKNGLEKIKTVGDAYIAVCGLPHEDPLHAIKIVNAAIQIREFMEIYKLESQHAGKSFFEVRIGVNTGQVVAGIVGIKKFAYDIWGDAVNIAARMEEKSEPSKINVSGITYPYIKDHFICEYRGKIEAKNKGEIDMYFVKNKISHDS